MMSNHAFSGLDWLSTATVALTSSLRILSVNAAAETLFQHSRRHMLGLRISEFVPNDSSLMGSIDRALAAQASSTEQELEIRVGAMEHATVSCTINVIESSDAALILEFRRIDQWRKAERDARMAEQLNANRELIRNLAHEIKNPLGGVRGAAQLLARELNAPHLTEYTQVIIAETDRLQNLLNRLLTPHTLARANAREAVNIHEVLTHVVTLIDAEFNHGAAHLTIEKDFDVSLPPLIADREQLTQAVLNVVRNAAQMLMQAQTKNARIDVSTRVARGFTVAKQRVRLGLAVTIADNGLGIAPDMIDKVFQPLVSRRDGGTGLGLTITQMIVSQHQGTIEVASEPGKTRFTLMLPLGEGK